MKLFTHYTAFVHRRRVAVLLCALVLVIIGLYFAANIGVATDIQDLLPADNPQARAFTRTNDLFSTSSIIVTVEGEDKELLALAAEDLTGAISADRDLDPYLSHITLGIDRDFMIDRMLWIADPDEYEDLTEILQDPGLLEIVRSYNDNLENAWFDEGTEDAVTPTDEEELVDMYTSAGDFAQLLTSSLEGSENDSSREMAETFLLGSEYMYSPLGDMLLFQIIPDFDITQRDILTTVMEKVRAHIRTAEKTYPDLTFGTAGDIPQEADEEAALSFDMLYPALAAVIIIFVLFFLTLHSLRSVLFAVTALAAGIIFDLGIIGATIGELNMITSSFGALLVGLGIDFGIHIISYYGDLIDSGRDSEAAMVDTLKRIGKPVAVGGITTALAFFALCLSSTKGFVQFGFVAGTGILLVLASMFTILPALLLTFGAPSSKKRMKKIQFAFLEKWGSVLEGRAKGIVLAVFILLVTGAGILLPGLEFNYDLRQIGPQNTPSKQTEQRILDTFGLSPFPSFLTVDSIEEGRRITEQLLEEKRIARVESISRLIQPPEIQDLRHRQLESFREARTRHDASSKRYSPQYREDLAYEIQRLEWNLTEIADMTSATLGDDNELLKVRDHMIREIRGAETGRAGEEVFQKAIAAVEGTSLEKLSSTARAFSASMDNLISEMSRDNTPLTSAELPADIRRSYVSTDGESYLITIYPTEEMTDNEGIFAFEEAVRSIDPGITGTIQLSLELGREILRETRTAGFLVLGVVFLLLLVSFRSIKASVLAVLNLLAAVVLMMGLYSLIEKMNIVNALALPLIIGIGIDYGIHIIHHLRSGHSMETTFRHAGKAILLSAATTMTGFGSLALLGTFKGISTLGILLFLGSAMCLLSSFTFLPALAGMFYRSADRNTAVKTTIEE